jgi:hypothetical protein
VTIDVNPQDPLTGAINGRLDGVSHNGYQVTYSIASGPKYGQITDFNSATGEYTYVPNPKLVNPGVTDSFTIVADNGAGAQLPGVLGLIQDALHSLAIRLNLARPDTVEETFTVKVLGDGAYGDTTNAQWAILNQSYENCTLNATAAAIRQVTSGAKAPDEQDMVALAKANNSVDRPGAKMYLDENTSDGVAVKDAVALMAKEFGLTANTTHYDDSPGAMADLQANLAYGNATMVTVSASLMWNAIPDASNDGNPNYTDLDHEIVVIAVNLKEGVVYVNDSSATNTKDQPIGAGMKVSLAAFLSSWKTSRYELTVVDKPV